MATTGRDALHQLFGTDVPDEMLPHGSYLSIAAGIKRDIITTMDQRSDDGASVDVPQHAGGTAVSMFVAARGGGRV
jgi:hypothetical protein